MSADGVGRLFSVILEVWPEHQRHLDRTLAAMTSGERRHADLAAGLVMRIAGTDLRRFCEDYAWVCAQMQEEQLYFARTGQYRLATFQEARDRVYGNAAFMERYLNGLLIGRICWLEQLQMLAYYVDEFVPGNPDGYRHLEVGPGHGLLLYLASLDPRCAEIAGLDVSESSLAATARCMEQLGAPRRPTLVAHDILSQLPPDFGTWDSIVASEVLEHLEAPGLALRHLVSALHADGRIFVTTPVNTPMPDHIHLFEDPEQVLDLVTAAGLEILDHRLFTGVGVSEERARKRKMPIACAIIARPSPAGKGWTP